jgi:hypothetical protein
VIGYDFARSEGLRRLLVRLHAAGPGAWREDPEAAALMRYSIEKYGALARRHHLEPEEAAAAAFEVMRTGAARTAQDPWAVVTRAVQVTLIAEERANGLLCSTDRARRSAVSAFHDAERFSDRDTSLLEYHPAFQVPAEQDLTPADPDRRGDAEDASTTAQQAVDSAVALFQALGWPRDTARTTLDYICARLIEAGSRTNAHEVLRRDHHARALLDLDRPAWAAVLRVVLGSPNPDLIHTAAGHGLLLRLLIGHQPAELLADDDLVATISTTAARVAGRTHA